MNCNKIFGMKKLADTIKNNFSISSAIEKIKIYR
jgi:hypothetical protein